ncbi:hypothetical protein COEREDRAFT_80198 [Coemansia reversa NRRL 1564]|uniref:DNA-binding TFAR19-related protein n=1 Tax=Coemansia reversa (strain ATCC 12441 / NRRL 1564) TaxID=763665 RepID=A0A2G5BFU7_COERN|nr:hypothetical protein COEREDRAFT_80198 [Coemansia reversa NRRL 1564]|eukprot:PIA17871.1 hypothetical protein COEREDRAFT_80198 [Coemansia reversa NRRL 1564]
MANLDLGRITGQQFPQALGSQTENDNTAEAKRKEMEEKQNRMLGQILQKDAYNRLQSMKMLKREQINAVEGILLHMSANGQIRKRLSDEELKQLLKGFATEDEDVYDF